MDDELNLPPVKDLKAEVSVVVEEMNKPPVNDLQPEMLGMGKESNSSLNGRNFGHCIVSWEIKNYGRSLWQNNFKIGTPEFFVTGPDTHDTKWKLMLQTESNHKSLFEDSKVNINCKEKEDSLHLSSLQLFEFKLAENMKEHEKKKFDLMCSLIDNNVTDSKLSIKNLMLHLERAKSDNGPNGVCVDWRVFYIGMSGEKYPLAHEEHLFTKKSGYGFNIGTLYDFEKDFEYNSGVMTILCEMIVKYVHPTIDFHDEMDIDLHGLSEDLQCSFEKRKFCDAEIIVEGKKINAHKAILCSHSSVFESLFKAKDADVVEILGMKYDEIAKIIEYMYSHDIKTVVGKPSLSLYYCAIQMNLKGLVEHYEQEQQNIYTTIDARKLTFQWNIQDFSTKEINCISSPILSNGTDNDAAWQINLYPSGTNGSSEFIAVSVECIEGNISEDLCIQCAVLRENEKLNVWKILPISEDSVTVFENQKFIERENAFKLLNNDALRIGLKVRTCLGKETSIVHKPCTPVLYSMKKSFENMANNMLSLRQSSNYSDVILEIGKEEIKAHKFILSARSHLLARKLEENDSVCFPNVSPTIFKILLDYMYCATLNDSDVDKIIDVYKAAEEFIMPRLQEKCSLILRDRVTVDKVCSILRLAEEYFDEYLKVTVLEFVKRNENKFKGHILENYLKQKTSLLWCGREMSDKSETSPAKPSVKRISVIHYAPKSIFTYKLEINSKTLRVKDSRTEKTDEKPLIFLESAENKNVQWCELLKKTVKDSCTIKENSSTEILQPVTCEMNIQGKIHNGFGVPLKKRYRNEMKFSESSEEKKANEQVQQPCEMKFSESSEEKKANEQVQQPCEMKNFEQSKVDLMRTSCSGSKNIAKEKPSHTSNEIKNKGKTNSEDKKCTDETFSSFKSL